MACKKIQPDLWQCLDMIWSLYQFLLSYTQCKKIVITVTKIKLILYWKCKFLDLSTCICYFSLVYLRRYEKVERAPFQFQFNEYLNTLRRPVISKLFINNVIFCVTAVSIKYV
jgi:hypothetical protein